MVRALRERGHTEGKNIIILSRHAGERAEQANRIVRELVQEPVVVIVAAPTPAAHAARRGTSTIRGDLPIRQTTRYELAVDLKAAKALGVTIPPCVLDRADEVIR